MFIAAAAFFVAPLLRDQLDKLPVMVRVGVVVAPAFAALAVLLRFTYLTTIKKLKIPLFSGWFMPLLIFILYGFFVFFPPTIR